VEDREDIAGAFEEWLSVVDGDPIPPDVVAVNLGLFETATGYGAYITGARRYDPDDDAWACKEDFVPRAKYFPVESAFSGMPWLDVASRYKRLLAGYLANHPSSQLHRLAAVTVGFDDGDLERVR
jgi:hypothetical protein